MPLLDKPARARATFHRLRVRRVERLTDASVAVTFVVPPELWDEYGYRAGQHLTLRATIAGEEVRQSYSISQRPVSPGGVAEGGTLRIASAEVPGGRMSTWLNRVLQVGDEVDVLPPLGTFVLEPQPERARHHVAVAAGSGITPVLAVLQTALADEPLSRATLLYGNRRTDTVMFLEELEDLKNAHPGRFQLVHVLSREPQDVELFSGRLDRDRLERILDTLVPTDGVDEWWLCGPLGLVTTAQEVLAERGVGREHVHHEIFHADDAPARPTPSTAEPVDDAAPPVAVVTVTLDGRSTEVPMRSREETVLAATLRARPDAPYSCTGGVCGTCRARLVEGEVTMDRHYALEDDEVAAGIVLTCQAHPVTDRVRLDYDA